MSLYYEYKSRCNHNNVAAAESRHDDDQKCFCGKFLKPFLGRIVTIQADAPTSGNLPGYRIVCFDKKSGLVTAVPAAGGNPTYLCCKDIVYISVLPANG
ncbi:hypothetical protein [Sutcliffiella horikoshii]|uniref:hypothetical protein n=1 Tax=Sutcliffiella horikoshii TaxID=79883 RepID=UPI00385064BB